MRRRISILAVLAAGCGLDHPPPVVGSTVIDEDICDWEPGDLTVVAADAVVTPAGIAVACHQPGADASSLLVIDATTHEKRTIYTGAQFDVRSMQLANADTLLLFGARSQLFVVPLGVYPAVPQRILARAEEAPMFTPTVIGDDVYYASISYSSETSAETYAIEKVALSGGPDQIGVVVTSLPYLTQYLVSSSHALDAFSEPEAMTVVSRLDLGAASPALDTLMTRPRGPYEPMGFTGTIADRVLWQDEGVDPSQLVEIDVPSFVARVAPFHISYSARVVGDDIVQVSSADDDPWYGFVAVNLVDNTLRRAPLDAVWQEDYEVVGILDDQVYATETDVDRTRLVVSTLSPPRDF